MAKPKNIDLVSEQTANIKRFQYVVANPLINIFQTNKTTLTHRSVRVKHTIEVVGA